MQAVSYFLTGFLRQASAAQARNYLGITGSGVVVGNLTESISHVLVISGGAGAVVGAGTGIQIVKADAAHDGYLSQADWNTFNGKQASGSYLTDAPNDGTTYGRNSGAWSAVAAGGVDVLAVQVFS